MADDKELQRLANRYPNTFPDGISGVKAQAARATASPVAGDADARRLARRYPSAAAEISGGSRPEAVDPALLRRYPNTFRADREEAVDRELAEWREQIAKDPEIAGGQKAAVELVQRLGGAELVDALGVTADNPRVAKFLVRVAAELAASRGGRP